MSKKSWWDEGSSSAKGEQEVFVTAYQQYGGGEQTVSATLHLLGQDCYGQVLDPDARQPYESAVGYLAECQLMMSLSGTFTRVKIWRNGTENNNIVLADHKFNEPLTIMNDESLLLRLHVATEEAVMILSDGTILVGQDIARSNHLQIL